MKPKPTEESVVEAFRRYVPMNEDEFDRRRWHDGLDEKDLPIDNDSWWEILGKPVLYILALHIFIVTTIIWVWWNG